MILLIWALQKKRTAFYKIATCPIDIIVETPTNEAGQMHKVEEGKLKIQMVITCQSVLGCWVIKNTNFSVSGVSI